jgi:hypothetical protein
LQLASDIRKRIKSVELKFPDIKLSQYYKELREQAIQALEKISDQARLNIIKQMEKVSNLGKVKFMDKLIDKIHLYGEAELVALYKMI